MQVVVYVDLLVILNTVITLLIIIITADILKIDSHRIRYLSGAIAGGLFSLIILSPSLNVFLTLIIRALICGVIVLLSYKAVSIKRFFRCYFLFIIVSFLLAGIVYGVAYLINSNSVYSNNGYMYVDFGISGIILIVLASFLFIKTLNKKVFSKQKNEQIYDVCVEYNGNRIDVKALYDSGNNLVDIFTGKPVIIIAVNEIALLLDVDTFEGVNKLVYEKDCAFLPEKIRLLPVSTLGMRDVLPAFTADRVTVAGEDIHRIINKPCIAVSKNSFNDKKFTALINEAVIGQVI